MDRPNNTYGGQGRASALRNSRSPPRNDYRSGSNSGAAGLHTRNASRGTNKEPLSPLRSRIAQQTQQNTTMQNQSFGTMRRSSAGGGAGDDQSEEVMYERRRQGELRRQIEEKERELETVSSKHRERMNRHAGGPGGLPPLESSASMSNFRGGAAHHSNNYQHRSGSFSGAGYHESRGTNKRDSNSPLRAKDGVSGGHYQLQGATVSYGVRSSSSNGGFGGGGVSETANHQSRSGMTMGVNRLAPPTGGSRPPIPQVDNFTANSRRQKSPHSPGSLRHKTGGSRSPTRDIDMRDAASGLITGRGGASGGAPYRSQPTAHQGVSNEYLNQLQQDNQSLQKRLQLVLSELDRVSRDRTKLTEKVSVVQQDVASLQGRLNDYDDADKLNSNLQMDVNGQRDNNINIKCTITDTDMSRKECMQKLRGLQADRDRRNQMANELKDDLQKKMQLCQQLETEQYQARERVNDLERQISALSHQCHEDDTQIDQLKGVTDRLTDERDDLHNKLDQLKKAYDNCVGEITRERAQMQGHNRHHNKLLVAKVTFALLEQMFQRRKQEAMNEFFQYCKFDSKCHNTLKQFVKILERLGQFRQRIAIKQWHQRTFKPIEMKVQESDLCYDFMRRHLLSKMFNLWRTKQQNANNMYGAKTRALEAIWNSKAKDCQKDVQRAFQMWKDNAAFAKFRNQRCKRLVWKAYSNKLAKAFQKWMNFSVTLNQQCRYQILARTFAENQLKRITFCTLRYNLNEMRRKRLNRLRTYVKAWREANEYQKFMMHANKTVLSFKKDCNRSLLKMCFDAMRQSKEEEKFIMMQEALEQDCEPAIEAVSKQIEQKTQEAVRSGRSRSCDVFKNMIYKRIAEYFYKWKGVQQRQSIMINQNMKDMIIRRWQMSLRDAFDLWKRGKAAQEIQMQSAMVMEMQEEGSNLAAQVEDLSKKIDLKKKSVDRSGRSALNRGTNIMKRRYLKQYFDKWAEVNKTTNNQVDGADNVRKKMRNRFLRQAFDLWKEGHAHLILAERNEGSCEHLKQTLDHRQLRKCFNAMKAYNSKNETAKRYWKILLGKMDHWMKKRAFGLWMEGGNHMKLEMQIDHQNQLTEEMTVKNNELGSLTKRHADKCERNAVMSANLKKMGQRSMSNAFARAYYKRTAKAFETWKEWTRADKHREAVLRRTMDHWLKNNGKYLMAVMMNWKALAKINDTRKAIAGMNYEMGDMGIMQGHDENTFASRKQALIEATKAVKGEIDATVIKRSKIMAVMCDNTNNTHYQGRLRYIFLQWAAHTKRMVQFTRNIQNAIQKSMWQRGFQNIREFSRDKQLTRDQNKGCNKLRRMFWRLNCAAAFNKWRQTEYEQALEMITMTCENTQGLQGDFATRKRIIQRQNITRSARIVAKSQKWKVYQAWKNVTRWLKHKRVATEDLLQGQSSYACMRAVKKWRGRAESTKFARGCYQRFLAIKAKIYKRACFRHLMLKYQREKALVLRLSNVAKKFDNRGLMSAFQMIKNFEQAKRDALMNERAISSQKLGDVLHEIYMRKLHLYYMHMRRQVFGDKSTKLRQKTMFGHFVSRRVRDAFDRWKAKANLATTVIDVNEIGPITEEVLDKQLDIANLRNLMASEGFTEHQVEDVTHNASVKARELLAKSIGRWKCWNGTDDYLKPKMFDRWRRFVQFRRILKHWLDFIANRQQHQKADLSYCFNKWKFFFSDKQNALQRRTRAQLMSRAVAAAKRLEVLADSTQQDEEMINHISDQNEELFNNYRKGQKLALALGRDNQKFAMMKSFKLMMENSNRDKQKHLGGILEKNIALIAAIKGKIQELENDNDSLANENEELRQFSLDGYQLGKNVTSLTQEREKLSVDLADKADTIKKLLDENERLSAQLRQTQENVMQASRA